MAIWIELRCEKRGEGREKWNEPCWSDENNGPGEMADDTKTSVEKTLTFLATEAKKAGWKKLKEGWVCPCCLAQTTKEAQKQ